MKRFITFGSIGQFRNTIKEVQHSTRYQSWDEDKNEPIYNNLIPMPILKIVASEKIHGTNAAVCYSNLDGFWVQSRKNIITPEKDNASCASIAYQNKEQWMNIIQVLATEWDIDLNKNIISIYFEWSGGNIQKHSAVSGLDKRAIIFQHFKISPIEPQLEDDGVEKPESARWLETSILPNNQPLIWLDFREVGIYNIMKFPTYEFEIDFNQPLMSQNKMIELVEKIIEPNSPVGVQFKCQGDIGEGIICTFTYKGSIHRFKVKGEAHSASKVKTLKPVDEAKEQKKIDLANKVTPGWRLEQMYTEVFDTLNGGKGDIKYTSDFLKAVNKDILKEESDIIAETGLEPKDIFGKVAQISKIWLFEQLDKEAVL